MYISLSDSIRYNLLNVFSKGLGFIVNEILLLLLLLLSILLFSIFLNPFEGLILLNKLIINCFNLLVLILEYTFKLKILSIYTSLKGINPKMQYEVNIIN